ncbi:MAG: Golgi apyrase [Trizodia sp. TS-e1964]|nr:MAG: Golgi apyrase [Trizodia sp. TS-e1964]
MGKWRYGVILDAGSSGTRVYVYKWLENSKAKKVASMSEMKNLPVLTTQKKWAKKIKPGISAFADKPELVGPDHLESLLLHALDHVPENAVPSTPLFLMATAGMRLLPLNKQRELLSQICTYAQSTTNFLLPDCDLHIQIIPGETEGLYGWVAANYLLGGFDRPEEHAHGKGHHTYGFLDMGGASAQIAFVPNATETLKHANDLKLLRLRSIDGVPSEYQVYTNTWLGFGMNQARKRYIEALLDSSSTHDAKELPDPCLPVGLSVTKDGKFISPETSESQGKETFLLGTGRFAECLQQTYPLLDITGPCQSQPCLHKGGNVPAIDFEVNHFVGVSEFWHTTHEVFDISHKDENYDFATYQNRVKAFCSQDWDDITKGVAAGKWGEKVNEATVAEVCFKASWLINVLHDGIGIPRIGLENMNATAHNSTKDVMQHATNRGYLDPFQAVNKIDNVEVSWTLGKMVLYAASLVPPHEGNLPVGFGSNIQGIPTDFQYGGSKLETLPPAPIDDELGADDWHDEIFSEDSPRRFPGLIILLLLACLILFILWGRDRRKKVFRIIASTFGRPGGFRKRKFFGGKMSFFGNGNSALYERAMEEGSTMHEFELADAYTDENDNSDSSDSTAAGNLVARSSGWATPRMKSGFDHGSGGYFDKVPSQGIGLGIGPSNISLGNAMDRGGLVVRTDSRERLSAPPSFLASGKRSRNSSPTRHKSPLIVPLEE